MSRYLYILIVVFLLIAGCKKESFPDEFSIFGNWKEMTTDTIFTEINFKRQNYLLLQLRGDSVREYRYLLNKPNELEIFDLAEYPSGRKNIHQITYNSKNEQMTIYSLYPDVDGKQSSTVFVRR